MGSSAGDAGAAAGRGGQPGSPAPGSGRSGEGDSSDTAVGATESSRGEHSDQPPSLDEGMSDTEETFSEETGGAAGGGGAAAGSTGGGGAASSAAERVSELESALGTSISSYDGMIQRERENIANRANAQGSEDELEEEVSGPLFDEIGAAGDAESKEDSPGSAYESGGGGTMPAGGPSRAGDYQTAGGAPPPADIPSGNDDDIVARQIREAAMKETDPELRDKLWEEYRKYKNQQ